LARPELVDDGLWELLKTLLSAPAHPMGTRPSLTFGLPHPRGEDARFVSEASPQEALLVYRKAGAGDRLLAGLLRRDHREATRPRSLGPLPLGGPTFSSTVTYQWKLLATRNMPKTESRHDILMPYVLNRCPTAVSKGRDRRPLTMAQKIAIWKGAARQGEWAEDGQRCTWQSLRICATEAGYTLESNKGRATDQ